MVHDRQVFGSIVLIGFLAFSLMRVADVAQPPPMRYSSGMRPR
jgi:hypothetical protein